MKTKKAISLIVLVITIIVLAILAATVIVSITNSGIINSASDTVKSYDLSEVRSMANLAWAEALMDSTVTSDAEYKNYVQNYLTNAGVDTTKYDVDVTSAGTSVVALIATKPHPDQELEGVIGLDSDGNVVDMDVWYYMPELDGNDKVIGYALGSLGEGAYTGGFIKGEITTNVPAYIKDVGDTNFMPVIRMYGVFYDIEELQVMPRLPKKLDGFSYTFAEGCGLKVASGIPNGVTSLFFAFSNNTSLTTVEALPDSITNMYFAFRGCTSLTTVKKLPKNVVDLSSAFEGCTSLEIAPIIPENVENIQYMFNGCTNLKGIVRINSKNITGFAFAFDGISNPLTIQVPANSLTYDNLKRTIWFKFKHNHRTILSLI